MENRGFDTLSNEHYSELFFGDIGLVEMKYRVFCGTKEIDCVAWLNEQLGITNTKKSKHAEIEMLGELLLDKKFKLFVDQQLTSLQEDAKEYYKQKITQAHTEFQKYIAEKFDVLEEKIKQNLEEWK
ncbi:hypothetical protein MHB42_00755 [Lysinibacillus sp. FSL K6-0232]|uniref:hypothetical protein n=1 Tax=Lysinibacillus sp. FSL K6-0232 TaxID=2921425 RepID=UPI0030FB7E26